jgi:uncharacterized protein
MARLEGVEPMNYHQRINLPYRYTAGEANTDFLRSLEAGRIVGSRCDTCDAVLVPARPFCPTCSGRTGERVEVEPTGEVVSHTTAPNGERVALIRLDGSATSFPHRIAGGEIRIGSRVKARFSDERSAEITAIEAFEPI